MKTFSGWSEWPAHEHMLNAELQPMGHNRPEGIHWSEIIHELKKGLGKQFKPIPGAQEGVQMIEGFLFEVALEYVLAGAGIDEAMNLAFKRYMSEIRRDIITQMQLERDDIHMTPDGFNEKEGLFESYKCTRRSVKYAKTAELFHENFYDWEMQEGGYCWAKGVDTARWIVLWQAGDYSQGPGAPPLILQATATWDPEELRDIWKMGLRIKKRIERENNESRD